MFKPLFDISNYYFNFFAVPVMLVSLLIISIGLFVFKQNRRAIVNLAFSLICFSTGFWLFSISLVYFSHSPQTALLWYRYFTFFGVVNIMPSLLLFSTAWLGELKRKKYFLIINYIISLLFYILAIDTDNFISPHAIRKYFWGYYPIYTLWTVPFLIFFFIQVILTVRDLRVAYKTEGDYLRKMSKKIIFIASLIGFTASVDFLPKLINLPWLYPYGYISMLIYISLVAYAIARYRFMDITLTVTRTGIFVAVYTLVLGLPFLLLTAGKNWLMQFLGLNWWAGPLVLLTVLATAGPFFYIYLQKRAEAILLREQLRYRETLRQAAREMARIHNLKKLLNLIVHIVTKTVNITHSAIYLFHNESKEIVLEASRNLKKQPITSLDGMRLLIVWLQNHREPLVQEELRRKDQQNPNPVFKELEEEMGLLNAEVIVPGFLRDKLIGFLILGHKRSGKIYTTEDLNTFSLLANQAALAIENALLYENMEEQVRQRTKELVEVQKQLIQAEKLATVGILAGGVAHEINNPLTAILTNVQMLLISQPVDDKLDRESLELIEEATKRCRTIVQKLMAYAKKPLETAEIFKVNLLDVLKNVISFLGYQLEHDGIKVTIGSKEDSYLVTGSQNELEQVATNIILNARDAIKQVKKSGDIRISLVENGKWIKMSVKDEGAGIPKEILPKIFDPFFTTKEVGKGTGLGLSICQSIIEKHHGLITVQSEPGKGSVFTVQLPKNA